MHATQDNISFAPPQPPGRVRAFGLALLAHGLLLVALTWSVHWKQTESAAVEAEIWSSVTQQAAPKAVEEPPPPPPVQVTPPAPVPTPQPVEKVQPPPAPEIKDADIALERAKKKREAEKLEQAAQDKADKLEKAKREKLRLEKEKQDAQKAQDEADKKRADEKRAKDKKAAQDKQAALDAQQKDDAAQKAKDQADAKNLAAQRKANLERMMAGAAGATGAANATGSALQSSGPSSGYGGRVTAKVRPNIVFPDSIEGNPAADVEVRSSPDGTIISRKLVKSSGNKAWDDAVLKAIDKTETMPRDNDGRVPSPLIIGFTPKN
ncbi:cell envelope integrity protein TolA [Rhodoferax sp.]|uniref:cell envelope integrity protein TolA n=1 Tax=Rhodoferax sp. TaxID=50421 RepID=UPI00374D0FA9